MRKKITLLLTLSFAANRLFAQEMFGSFAKDLKAEVEEYFPYVIAIVFIVSGLFNLGKFFGEERDYKKGITNILLYVGATLLLMGAYKYLSGLSL